MKNLIKFLSFIMMAVLPMTSCTEDPEDAMGSITGSVTQAPKGTEPLSGVTVKIVSTGQSTTTGSSGAFTFSNMTPGKYSLQFSKAGYTTNSQTVTVLAGNEAKCDIQLSKSTGTLTGTVTLAPKGTEPLSGVTVKIATTGQSTTTGSDGVFIFNDMDPGSYSLQFTKTGYTTNSRTVSVAAGSEAKCDIQLEKESEEAEIVINPSSLNFGTTQTDMNVTIKNNGNTTAAWSIDLGNNPWLSASQVSGSIQAGRTQSITFSVNRDYLSETRSIIVNLQAFGNSFPISISCAPRNTSSNMTVEPTILNFESGVSQQTLTIRNTGTAPLNWTASGLSTNGLSLSAEKGSISGGGSTVVVVTVDRTVITGDLITTFIITDGVKDKTVVVNIKKDNGTKPNDPNNPDNPDDPNNPDTPTPPDNPSDPSKFVVTNGLSVYYTLNDNYDDAVGDYDGFGINDPTFVEGVTGEAVKFSKTKESAINIPYGLISNKTFSICFWAKDLADGIIFFSKCPDNRNRYTLSMYNGFLKFICGFYNNAYQYTSEDTKFLHANISNDKWHHIAIVAEYESIKNTYWTTTLYIDGKRAGTINEYVSYGSPNEFLKSSSFIIGGKADLYNNILTTSNFTIDNFRMYDTRALTAEEIKEIYNARQ